MSNKFDICLMNPPYGDGNSKPYHLLFTDKCLEICNRIIDIMPFKLVSGTGDKFNKSKTHFTPKLISVEEVSSKVFTDTNQDNVGIYVFDNDKDKDDIISINYLDGKNLEVDSLLDIKGYDDIDEDILKYLDNEGVIKSHFFPLELSTAKEKESDGAPWMKCQKAVERLDGDVYLTCNFANGSMNATFINSNNGKIFTDVEDIFDDWKRRKFATFVILSFNSKEEAENCRDAMKRPLLRFGLYQVQDDRHLHLKCYRHIPMIDWSSEECRTDEGILKVCGCPKDKIKEYVDYATETIRKVDNKEISKKRN